MEKKVQQIFLFFYVSFFIPFSITFLLPLIQRLVLGIDRAYYEKRLLDISNCMIIIVSILLILSTFLVTRKGDNKILVYIIGIVITFVCGCLPIASNTVFIPISKLQCLTVISYFVFVLILLFKYYGKKKQSFIS